ncbi:purine nucleoside permease [Diplodia corticola]|uniref:Purine nucleoside permease n=1 Tax=Diplodia corticola TaxID=236234 RepID=A0A1J9R7W3_9PEZI|nr:purine nucleoside permease [Diplodia corticola]OJD36609.1 purine nucleoside permease [Diplodia corticola]
MRFCTLSSIAAVAAAFSFFLSVSASPSTSRQDVVQHRYDGAEMAARGVRARETEKIKPKVFIVSMFDPEAEVWWGIPEFDLLARNISVPGFSPLFPEAHCTADGEICQLITGEGEINAAVTLTALYTSALFDLTTTYFLIAGIAGISPEVGTLGSVTFARYAVQVALQYEFDAREPSLPANWTTAYIPQGATQPLAYPSSLYGTEVFALNPTLRDTALRLAANATLADSPAAITYRAHYAPQSSNTTANYTAASLPPGLTACDTATSDVYWSGALLGRAFAAYTSLATNGSALYCSTQQEDNASLEALLRGARARFLDFARVVVMRTASDFDRPYEGESAVENLLYADQGGFEPAVENIYRAGVRVVGGIVGGWEGEDGFEAGVAPGAYVGDVFGSLGGEPDFGPGSVFEDGEGDGVAERKVRRRGVVGRRHRRPGARRGVAGSLRP